METIRTILHATDFSEQARHAFRIACSLAREHKSKVILLHVAMPPYPVVGEMAYAAPVPVFEEQEEERRQELRKQLQSMRAAYPDLNIECRLEVGTPTTEILAVATQASANLIVVGTHGRTGLTRLLMGSVAEELVRKAPCSVLTVRAPGPVELDAPAEGSRTAVAGAN